MVPQAICVPDDFLDLRLAACYFAHGCRSLSSRQPRMQQSDARGQDREGDLAHTAENFVSDPGREDSAAARASPAAKGGSRQLAEQALAHHSHADNEERQDRDCDHGADTVILDQRVFFPVAREQIPESCAGAGNQSSANNSQHAESLARYENALSYAPPTRSTGTNFSGQDINSG